VKGVRTLVLALAVVLAGAPAAAQMTDADRAQQRYQAGMVHFRLDEWDEAIAEFQAGFRLKPAPQFLYNIAQAYRLSKRPDKALAYYRKYLAMDPDAPNRAEVERRISELTEQVQRSPVAPTPPSPSPPPPREPTSSTSTSGRADLVAHPPEKKPVYRRGWFWGVMAGTAVVVGGAVALGVVLGTQKGSTTLPPAEFN
jgi:tetratricopeptide (TPR) repeat protein